MEPTDTMLSGSIQGHKVTYIDNQGCKVMKTYGIFASKVYIIIYIITLTAESNKFACYLPIAQKMIDSFEIRPAGAPVR